MQELRALQQTAITGEPSLQNSVELAMKSLKLLPSHASKEILIIIGALTTCDPGDINETIQVYFILRDNFISPRILLNINIVLEYENRQY